MFKTLITDMATTIDWTNPTVVVYSTATVAGSKGDKGDQGDAGANGTDGYNGYSPYLAISIDGDRYVLQVSGWYGGTGDEPPTGSYIGSTGLVTDIADAVDIRGIQGEQGSQGIQGNAGSNGVDGNDGWSPILAVVTDGERRVLQVTDWTGGTGTKPATGDYIGSSGLVSSIGSAVDIRGAASPIPSYTWSALQAITGTSGQLAFASDIGAAPGTLFAYNSTAGLWRPVGSSVNIYANLTGYINFGGTSASYSQSGTTVTVTQTAHGITSEANGSYIFLTQNTGTFVTEWCSNLTVTGPDTFTCTSATSRTTSGNLGSNTSETTLPWSFQVPAGLVKQKDTLASAFMVKAKNSAGSKVTRPYYNSVLASAVGGVSTITTGGFYANVGAAAQIFMTDSAYVTSGVSSSYVTDVNRTYTVSSQLTNAADWHMIIPIAVALTARKGL